MPVPTDYNISVKYIILLARAVEYTDCFSAKE